MVGVGVMVAGDVEVIVGVSVRDAVKVTVGVKVPVGVCVLVMVGVGLGNASSTLKLSVFATHAFVAVPDHIVTFTTWSDEMAPMLYIPRPSGMIISPVCGLALGPIKVESLGRKNDPLLMIVPPLEPPTTSTLQ